MTTFNSRRIKAFAQALVCASAALLTPAMATELVGRVVDNSDARVFSGATVQVRSNAASRFDALTTDDEGFFRVSSMPSGVYLLDVSLLDGRTFMARLIIRSQRTTQFLELDYSRAVAPDDEY